MSAKKKKKNQVPVKLLRTLLVCPSGWRLGFGVAVQRVTLCGLLVAPTFGAVISVLSSAGSATLQPASLGT